MDYNPEMNREGTNHDNYIQSDEEDNKGANEVANIKDKQDKVDPNENKDQGDPAQQNDKKC